MMDVKPLHNAQDYDLAIREVACYFEIELAPGTADGDRFEVLSTLIKAYEDERFAAPHGDLIEVLRFAIEVQWENREPNWPPLLEQSTLLKS
jgi:HTH-type transcriptional regulator/antitoxin HigA